MDYNEHLQIGKYLRQLNEFGVDEIVLEKNHESLGHDNMKKTVNKDVLLKKIFERSKDCKKCSLGLSRTNFVFGEGNKDARIFFVGEAPGHDEDIQGRPFVGRSGKLLTKMIEAMGIMRDDIYIGNILKCRPPNNRDPERKEVDLCIPILHEQIKAVNPDIICVLGRIAAQTLLNTKEPLGKLRERIHMFNGVKLIVTYHPSALLRNPNWKKPAWDDLKMLMKEINLNK